MPVITKEIQVPSEEGLRVTIRKLSYFHVKKAKGARLSEVMGQARDAAAYRDLIASVNPEVQAAAEARAREAEDDPTVAYDMQLTLHAGIVNWSYPEPSSSSNIDDLLGPQQAEEIFRAIVEFTERPADERKGSPLSFAPVSAGAAEAAGQSN